MASNTVHESRLDQSSQGLLDRLDELLADCTPLEAENEFGPDYAAQLEEAKKVSAAHQETTLQVVIGKVCQLLETKSMTYFRMLSIGCGDGLFDLKILQAITDRFPAIKIHYIGTDIDEQICRKATELLSSLKNVEVEVRVIDFQQVDSSKITEIPPCDLVLAAHVFYYMRDINKALSEAQMLRKSDGCILILLSSSKFPSCELSRRFWLQEHKWPLNFSESAVEMLDKLGIKYKVEMIKGEVDFTEYFRDEFQKSNQKHILDFATHTKIERYPPAVSQTCMDYLASIATGKPKKYILPFSTDIIVIKN